MTQSHLIPWSLSITNQARYLGVSQPAGPGHQPRTWMEDKPRLKKGQLLLMLLGFMPVPLGECC